MTSSIMVNFGVKGAKHNAVIYIKDGIAILKCEDWRVAKQIYDVESRDPNAKISWDSKRKVMIEFFPNKKEAQIVDEIKARVGKLKRI